MQKNASSRRRRMLPALAALLLLFVAGSALAQDSSSSATTASNQELHVSDILRLPGKVLGEGSNTKGVGQFKVAKFRLEEVALPQTAHVEIAGQKADVNKAFRLTVVGGPFPVRAMPPVIWVDDTAVGYGVENEDLTEITVVFFDGALIREGASLYLSYGDKENKKERTQLPEKLNLGGAKGGQQ